jgi:hypothetical protein
MLLLYTGKYGKTALQNQLVKLYPRIFEITDLVLFVLIYLYNKKIFLRKPSGAKSIAFRQENSLTDDQSDIPQMSSRN